MFFHLGQWRLTREEIFKLYHLRVLRSYVYVALSANVFLWSSVSLIVQRRRNCHGNENYVADSKTKVRWPYAVRPANYRRVSINFEFVC